ncbi:PhoX family protein [Acinetobacter sp. ANC 4648]|uniref:PhoX family protein n=1 Tax=Acinetobacter sp. ANC 4648 TaxID=1977875 RepID=UPI000A3322EB|nr:alkaline phosphatase PhoX [Acinetobacter sp. ANC 4648]OTG84916.1 alkaline phosphatase [Acinetobacter sp. ANC 4648]
MTNSANQPTRREVLKWLASIPFLPLGAMATSAALVGCNDDKDVVVAPPVKAAKLKTATFTPMDAPTLANAAAMATTTVASGLAVTWDDNTKTNYKLAYKTFFQTGDMVSDGKGGKVLAGGYYDINNKPIMDNSVTAKARQFFSDCPDGTSLLTVVDAKVDGVKGKPVFAVVQFEYTTRDQAGNDMYGKLPSPIAVLTLDQDQKTGHLSLVKYHNVDMSKAHGLWITCGASLSPWGTHLSSEEYEPDAFGQGLGTDMTTMKAYSKNVYGDETSAKPYNYGHLPEITVNKDGTGTAKKHYCLGRISHELIQMMPDNRTALMGDDYTNGGLFMFVADKEKDLSAGTLYVAKYLNELNETSIAQIQWINLGHATSQEIDDLVNVKNIQPTDIMESLDKDPQDASYTKVILAKKTIWVKVKPGMEKAAAFLETHRYAALKGGSMAFTKMEGTTVNAKDKVAYSALANIQDSMIKGNAAWLPAHNVSFAKKISAGGIMAHDMKAAMSDTLGAAIKSDWAPYQSHMLLIGKDIDAASDPLAIGNTCDPRTIASADNLKFSETFRTLFIGEDSGNHVNNYLWAYNVDSKSLDRILSCPAGAESTGLHAVDSINGWTYIMSNFQHPGDWSSLHKQVEATLDPLIRANYNDRFAAAVGYLTADPIAPSVEKKAS